MYLRLFNREEKPCRREGSWQVQAVITDQRPSRVITDRETVDQLKSRTPQSVVMRPHTHDGPIGCCTVKPSLSSFTYSRGSRWPCGSPCGVGGASYPGHSAASCPLLSGKLRDLAREQPTCPAKSSLASPLHHRRLLYRGAGKAAHALQHMSPCISESARKWFSDLPYIRHMATGG